MSTFHFAGEPGNRRLRWLALYRIGWRAIMGSMGRTWWCGGAMAIVVTCVGCTSAADDNRMASTAAESTRLPASSRQTDETAAPPALTTAESPAAEPPRAEDPSATAPDTIPVLNGAPDRGCVDVAGTLHAPASAWFTDSAGSAPLLNGDPVESSADDAFQRAVTDVAGRVAPQFEITERFDLQRPEAGCVTHHYAKLTDGDDELVVTTWRMESAGNPNWIANESSFATLDDSTLVASGSHIEVVLSVAPDGTTVRVTSYGAHAVELVAGWPTTTAPRPDAPPPGHAQLTVDELLDIARPVLAAQLDSR